MAARKRGRPRGSSTSPAVQIRVVPPRCPKCGSDLRDPYRLIQTRAIAGRLGPAGEQYDQIEWKRTRCRACGQVRIERHFRLVTPQPAKTRKAAAKVASDPPLEPETKIPDLHS